MSEYPAALFQNAIGAAIHLGDGLVNRQFTGNCLRGNQLHLVGDALPFGQCRRRPCSFQLIAERKRLRIIVQRTALPRRTPRRHVPKQVIEAPLHLRLS